MRPQSLRLACLAALVVTAPAGAQVFTGTLSPGSEPVAFATFGDCGDRNSILPPARVASMVKGWDIDFILASGDLNYGLTAVGHPDWDARIGVRYGDLIPGRADGRYPLQTASEARFFPVVGNHDTSVGGLGGGDVRGYVDYFVRNAPGHPERLPTGSGVHDDEVTYYDFTRGNVHFIMADSDRGRVDLAFAAAQNAWIANTLSTSTARWKFVVMHHPAYSSDGIHGSQGWMRGEHLAMADAVFAGHAHVYERIETAGTMFFTCGLGGRTFYPFRSVVHPDSRFRFNTAHGALRVTCTESGALFEFLSTDDGAGGANGGKIEDSVTLGDYTPINNVGAHEIELIAGQQVTVVTGVVPNGGGFGFVTATEVRDPGGQVVAAGSAIKFTAAVSGRHVVEVRSTTHLGGAYEVSVTTDPGSPPAGIELWRAQHFGFASVPEDSGDFADPDGDGCPNVGEYGLGTDPTAYDAHPGGPVSPRFLNDTTFFVLPLREGIRDDLDYTIEAAATLPGGWSPVSVRLAADRTWTGTAPVVVSPGNGRVVALRVAEVNSPSTRPARFYRLRVTRPIP